MSDAADGEGPPTCTGDAGDPCWVRMDGLPGHCDIWRATHPERLVTAAPTSCGSGCTLLDFGPYWTHSGEGGWIDEASGGHFVHLAGGDPSAGDADVHAIVGTDGRTAFAVHYPPNGGTVGVETCWATRFGVGEGFGAFDVQWALGASASPAQDIVYHSSLAELSTVTSAAHTIDTGGSLGILQLAVTSHGVIWERESGGQGVIDGTYVDLGSGVHHPRMVGGDVVWINQGGQLHVWSSGADSVLLDLSPLIADGGVLTDGTSLAWFEFMDMPLATSTLRIGPFVRSAAGFTARALEGPGLDALGGVMGDGLVAHPDYASGSPPTFLGYRVVDVASGTSRRWTPPAGQHPTYLHLVSRTELVVETHDATGYRIYVVDPSTLPSVP